MLRAIAVCAVFGACSHATVQTRRVAMLGYDHPRRVLVITRGADDLVERWQQAMRSSGAVTVTGVLVAPPSADVYLDNQLGLQLRPPRPASSETPDPLTDESLCKLAAGVPAEDLVAVTTSDAGNEQTVCEHQSCTPPKDSFGEGSSGQGSCGCDRYRHVSSTAVVGAHVRVIDAATCRSRAELTIVTKPRTIEYSPDTDGAAAHVAAAELFGVDARREVEHLFPSGRGVLAITSTQGHTIEVAHDRDPALVAGAVYELLPRRLGKTGARVRVERADDRTASLSVDRDTGAEPGDELRSPTGELRWSVVPLLGGGITRAGSHRSGQAMAAVAARFSTTRVPVFAEGQVAAELIPGLDTARLGGGVAAGVRWPLGPVAAIALGEVGLAQARQSGAAANGGFAGIGAGLELWLGPVFVFADLRHRSYSMQSFRDGSGTDVAVGHPNIDGTTTLVQVGAGQRF